MAMRTCTALVMALVAALTVLTACGPNDGADPVSSPAPPSSPTGSPTSGSPAPTPAPEKQEKQEKQGPLADEFERTGRAQFNLAQPLTQAQTGIADGESIVSIARTPPTLPLLATFGFASGTPLTIPANSIVVQELKGGQGYWFTVHQTFASYAAVHARLVQLKDQYHLDEDFITNWWALAKKLTPGQVGPPQFFDGRRDAVKVTVAVNYGKAGGVVPVDWFITP